MRFRLPLTAGVVGCWLFAATSAFAQKTPQRQEFDKVYQQAEALWKKGKYRESLVQSFFAKLAEKRPTAKALARAQRSVIALRRAETSAAAHPYYWAAFTATGR